MDWLLSLDVALFRFINITLSNPVLDRIMPFFSSNPFFFPTLLLVATALLWKGGARGRLFVLMVLIAVASGDGWIINLLKHGVGRLRPFNDILDTHLLVGRGGSGSMPSGHAADWFAATMTAFIYYRRSLRFMLPIAITVAFSRIYNGVHYPSDVIVGSIIGAGYAAAVVWSLDALWLWAGPKWYPLWWQRLPRAMFPEAMAPAIPANRVAVSPDLHWIRLGYVLIVFLALIRLVYLAAGKIELSEDEAYQWTWSRHLALSYYSKPPLIAYIQFLGTAIWGDTAFGVRFFSPLIAAAVSLATFRFMARQVGSRWAFGVLLLVTATPLLAVGATLMTIDPLSVLFWMSALIAGWKASRETGTTRDWFWTGLWMGLGFLSKYTNLFQWVCWILLFVLQPGARVHLRRPGPYLALLVNVVCTLPVLIWNAQNNWITLEHVSNDGRLGQGWHPKVFEFLLTETFLLNPVFFITSLVAVAVFVRRRRHNPFALYLFCMGAPLFLFYFLYSFHSRVYPNWIAPSILPLFCLLVVVARDSWAHQAVLLRRLLTSGTAFGLFLIVLLHDTNLLSKLFQRTLPPRVDTLRRVRGWSEQARIVENMRTQLSADGKPVFIIGDHYGLTSQLCFYMPSARVAVGSPRPVVYFRSTPHPENQFYFWPGYASRKGENALYVQQVDDPPLPSGWLWKWIRKGQFEPSGPPIAPPAPPALSRQFGSVRSLGISEIKYRDRILRRIQLFACYDLK